MRTLHKGVCVMAVLGVVASAGAEPLAPGKEGRYQLVAATPSHAKEGVIMFRIDTTTGKTWSYDSTNVDIATPEYMTGQRINQDEIKKEFGELIDSGKFVLVIPTYWKGVPEVPNGVTLRPSPVK